MNQKFGKGYKLCSQRTIELLFEKETKVKQFPFVLHYAAMELPTSERFQVVISAPKRIFRKAHERNRIKRLMREVMRKNKSNLEAKLSQSSQQLGLFLIYTSKEELTYSVLENKMENLLNKLIQQIN